VAAADLGRVGDLSRGAGGEAARRGADPPPRPVSAGDRCGTDRDDAVRVSVSAIDVVGKLDELKRRCAVIRGKAEVIEETIVALARGHVLIEDIP
jgi:hypothetical protein